MATDGVKNSPVFTDLQIQSCKSFLHWLQHDILEPVMGLKWPSNHIAAPGYPNLILLKASEIFQLQFKTVHFPQIKRTGDFLNPDDSQKLVGASETFYQEVSFCSRKKKMGHSQLKMIACYVSHHSKIVLSRNTKPFE